MSETQEIDALLISALYGELTPAEETALEAHLVSHPADKAALDALTSTRDAVRASRILQVQLDPPQSVSALLLQEAARRAPKAEKQEGWFARLARSFMLHPAMAAAAMLVVVIGTVTLVQNRKGDQFVETEPVATQKSSASDEGLVAQPGPARPESKTSNLAPSNLAGNGERSDRDQAFEAKGGDTAAQAGSGAIGGGESGKDNFHVQLADEDDSRRSIEQASLEKKKIARDDATKAPIAKNAKAGYAKQDASGAYMELRSPEPSVKDLEESPRTEAASDGAYARPPADEAEKELPATDYRNAGTVNAVTPGRSAGGQGASSAPSAPRGNAGPAVAKPAAVPADPKPESQAQATRKDVAGPGNAKAPPAPPPPPPPKVAATGAKTVAPATPPAEDKAANDPQLAWAREQHNAIVARVRGGDCKGAAAIAVNLANRDLAYYRQNVASDRAVKDCLAYIDNARERDQEQRAERQKAPKRTLNEPAKKAAPPANATSTDTK